MKTKDILLRKKLLLGAALTVIGITSLTACANNKEYAPKIGTIAYTGEINYDEFKNIKFVQLFNEETQEYEYYLVRFSHNENNDILYTDIETGNNIDNKAAVIIDNMKDYLNKKDMVKKVYNIDDIERVKEIIFTDEELNITKNVTLKRTLKA